MHPLIVTPCYAALLAILFVALSANVIRGRRQHRVSLGSGGIGELERRVRVHGNFAEYVPFTLLTIAMDELRGLNAVAIHGLCLALLVGRLTHAWGVLGKTLRPRVLGMGLTLGSLLIAAFCIALTA